MVYGGALASGALVARARVFGTVRPRASGPSPRSSRPARSATSLGAIGGWAIGLYGGRPFLERHGRCFHSARASSIAPSAGSSAGRTGRCSFGRVTPVVRSFVSIPAGVFEVPLRRYTILTAIGSRSGASRSPASAGRSERAGTACAPPLPVRRVSWSSRSIARARAVSRSSAGAGPLPMASRGPIPHVDVKAQYAPLIPELKEAFARTLESGRFIFGPEVEGFEREAAELPRRRAGDRRRERHRRARARPRRARDRRRRRGRSAPRSPSTPPPRRSRGRAPRPSSPTSTRRR